MKTNLVLMNGKVITLDAGGSISEAIAVGSGRIVKVGSNRAVEKFVGQETLVVDLKDRAVTPGMIDVHCHFAMGGISKVYVVDLRYPKVRSITEALKLVEARVKETPRGKWVQGRGWNEALFDERRYINRWDLDLVSPENPVILHHTSDHYISVNTYALELAGVTKDTPQPAGGTIVKDPSSKEPIGVFMEPPAMDLVRKKVPAWIVKEGEVGIKKAQELFLSEGVTTVKDPGVDDTTVQAYRNLRARGELMMRVYMLYHVNSLKQTKEAVKSLTKGGDDILRLGGLKIYLDGSGMARTAWMREDWNKNFTEIDEGNRGYPVIPVEEFRDMVKVAYKARFQIGVHTVGDRAVDEALHAYQAAFNEVPRNDVRHSVIHAIVPTEKALDKMEELDDNIVIEAQSPFLYFIGDNYAGNLGPTRIRRVIPLRSYVRRGITVGNSSDWPVCPFPPRFGLWAAVVRKAWKGTYGLQPFGTEESITVQEALRTYTIMAAKCLFMEDRIGSVEKGKYADLAVWSEDPYTVPTEDLKDLRNEMTIVEGRIVHREP